MFTSKQFLLCAPILLCGCASGFNREALQERLNDWTFQMPDAAIAEARAMKPQLKFPCRIAVYLKPGDHEWRWTAEDRAAMEGWAKTLMQDGIASEVFVLPDMLAGKEGDLKQLRVAAAKCGADVLFLIHGAAQTDSYKNAAAVLNLTVIGGYLVPGSHKDSLFMMEGCLIDVDNSYIYTAVQSEGVGKIIRPTFVIEEKDAIAAAKTKAIAAFGDEVLTRLRRMASGPPLYSGVDLNWKGTPPTAAGAPASGLPAQSNPMSAKMSGSGR